MNKKSNRISRIWAMALAVAMIVGLLMTNSTPVSAADEGTLNIHKLSSTALTAADLDAAKTYYEDPDNLGTYYEYLAGATYTIYKIGTFSQSTDSATNTVSAKYTPVSGLKNTSGGDVTAIDSSTVASSIDVTASGLGAVASGTTTATGALTISTGLDKDGIYLVKETALPAGMGSGTDFIITVPQYINDEWTYTVDAYPKNSSSTGSVSKAIKDDSGTLVNTYIANIGDIINYQIDVNVPTDYTSAEYTRFEIIDTSSEYLEYKFTSSAVDGLTITGTRTDASTYTLVATTDYTATYDNTNHVLTITLTDAGRAAITAGDKLSVSYKAEVLTGALEAKQGITNSAKIQFTKNGGDIDIDPDPDPDPDPIVLIASYGVKKIGDDNNALGGATFKLARINAAGDYEYLKYNTSTDTWEVDNSATYTTSTSGTELNSEAILQFKNLDKNTTYYLIETSAPTGYTVLPDAISIQATLDSTTAVYNTYDEDDNYVADTGYSIKIKNLLSTDGPILPTTGGNGIYMFLIIGIVLMGGAVVLYIKSKKSRKVTD